MAFEKGQSGNPGGRQKGEKIWRDALRRALARREEDDPQALEKLADTLVSMAADGDIQALRELADRLDGKPKQQTEITGGEDADGNAIPASINVNFRRGD